MFSIIKNICTNFIQSCSLCGAPTRTENALCKGCFNDLPWIKHACYRCNLPLAGHERLCPECTQHPPHFSSTQAAFVYRFPINAAINELKHKQGLQHATWLADCLYQKISKRPQAWPQAIIPVPLHRSRLLKRGFNQSLLLAQHLSQKTTIPLLANQLKKVKATENQFSLDAHHRHANLTQAFTYIGPQLDQIVVVDDVMTTGSTLNEISKTLLDHGVKRVDVWVIARTPKPDAHF